MSPAGVYVFVWSQIHGAVEWVLQFCFWDEQLLYHIKAIDR